MYVIIPIEIYIQISMYIPLNIWYNIRGLLRDRGSTHYVFAVGFFVCAVAGLGLLDPPVPGTSTCV